MRNSLLFAAVAAALVVTPGVSRADIVKKEEPVQRTLHFAGPGPHTLEVRTISGNVRIDGYDGTDVLMTSTRTATAETADDMAAAQRDVTFDVTDGAATIKAIARYRDGETCGDEQHRRNRDHDWPDYDVRYDFVIRVPRDTRLVICTINDGHVDVAGTRADFQLRSINGPINFVDMGGSGEATTINGAVKGSFSIAPRGDSVFKTLNGSVVLTMPQSFAADINMKTFNGGLYTDFDTQTLATPQAIIAESKGARTVYQSNSFARVRIGNGGPQMTMETLNGDVRVVRASH